MDVITHSAEETQSLAAQLAQQLKPGMVISLVGDLGTGKTTFTQGLGRALDVKRLIKSPTYTLVKEYAIPTGFLLHIDAYRLEDGGVMDLDLSSLLQEDAITVIEWAEFIREEMPENYLEIHFTMLESSKRQIKMTSVGNQLDYQEVIETLSG